MYLFPAIDLRGGKVVRLLKGDYDQQTTYGDSPVEQARQFADAGATWLHVVDLDGARSGSPEHLTAIAGICRATKLQVEVGGGIRNRTTIDQLLDAGVQRVILGTAAFQQWDWFKEQVHDPALHQRLVLGLDARHGKVALAGWEEQTEHSVLDIARQVSAWPLGAIVYTDIATDGTMQGPNVPATLEVAQATQVPVVASGGVGTLEHLRQLRTLPVQGAIVGRALYERAFTLAEALAVLER